jgi:tyrosine-specific transport protein
MKEGSVIGGALLIAGSCIGAGMLALPILTGVGGFFPSLIMFFIAWGFMTVTAFLLIEVNGWFEKRVNLLSMLYHTLGDWGRAFGWVLYLFLFYALLVAYITASGNHVSSFFLYNFSFSLPDWAGSIFFVILFGWIIYLGTRPVDLFNRWLMAGKIVSYLLLVGFGLKFVNWKMLQRMEMKYAFFSLPVLIISFGFHNMIPTLVDYMKGNVKRVKQTIWLGSLFAFVIYIIWVIVAIGILPLCGEGGILQSYSLDIDAAGAIKNFLRKNLVGDFAQSLAFFAILTSFLAQGLSVSHFLSDGLKIQHKKRENLWMCVLALAPPLIFSLLNPQLFFDALNFAGGICAVLLFGVFPVLMVWKGRYVHNIQSKYCVRGGKTLLVVIFALALFIVFYQLSQMVGIKIFPMPMKEIS